jgi:hypothetical protein
MPSQRATFFIVFREIASIVRLIPIAHKNRVRFVGLIYIFIKDQNIHNNRKTHRIFAV